MADETAANQVLWDLWTGLNQDAAMYDMAAFRQSASSLKEIERRELTDVTGKRLLHLQCHFGQDTLSWARQGAHVTGIDFSPEAIAAARALSQELAIPARFECADVLGLDLGERFDIVFTSYGVLAWLDDLDRWAAVVARHLAPDGRFYMVEFHPLATMLDDAGTRLAAPYFARAEPLKITERASYAGGDHAAVDSFQWPHHLGEIVTALAKAGLALRFLHEFPFSPYDCYPFLREAEPGRFIAKNQSVDVPLTFSLMAERL